MKTILKIIVFLLVLESVFAIHEYGHLQEFQRQGIPVKEFSLGIGPILYSHNTSSFVISLRAVPIMAYVAPTKEGERIYADKLPLSSRVAVDTADIRNNIVCGLVILLLLQILGWWKGNLSSGQLLETALLTPFKIILRFFVFLISCATYGRINLANKFLLSTGGIDPPKQLRQFLKLSLVLGTFNLAPIPPLNGGHAAQAILHSIGRSIQMPHIPSIVGIVFFFGFYMAASASSMRMLEVEPEESRNHRREKKTAMDRWREEAQQSDHFNLRQYLGCTGSFLSARTKNLLEKNMIETVEQLREYTPEQLLEIKNFGRGSLEEVKSFLYRRGLSLRPSPRPEKTNWYIPPR